MVKKVSVKAVARRERTFDHEARKATQTTGSLVLDSFVNFSQKMGMGADNPLSTSSYGFNPVTRNRVMLEWIHRGSWLGGVAIDVVAEDMTRAGVDLQSEMKPEQLEVIESEAVRLEIWKVLNETYKWGRLYGGALAFYMVEGQDPATELRIDTVGKDQFKGLLSLDRWMVEPSLNDLVTKMGPSLGKPKFYTVTNDAPGLRGKKIHYTRVIRLEGISLPYWQRVQENLWGISILERLYDRMVAFDSATMGAAQLVYKAHMQTYAIEGLREVVSAGGEPLDGLVKYVDMMRRFRGIEGMTLLDGKDKLETQTQPSFSGLSDALTQFGQQLSGALQIPLVRLFGQSPAGMNATGESDLRMYYDGIKQKQEADLRVPITAIYTMLGLSLGTRLPKGSRIEFRSLWQLTDKEKSEIAETTVRAVTAAESGGLLSQQGAMKELQASSRTTGIFTNITDDDIENAEISLPPAGEEAANLELEASSSSSGEELKDGKKPAAGLSDPKKKEKKKDEPKPKKKED